MFDDKYAEVDLKRVDPITIDNVEECDWLMMKLDEIIANIDESLGRARAEANEHGVYADVDWFHSAQRALRGARQRRQQMQMRRGTLAKQLRERTRAADEKSFINIARRILPPQAFQQIIDEVNNTK
jgi:hypothetical protein